MNFPKPFYRWCPHPRHGLQTGPEPPSILHGAMQDCEDEFGG